MNIIEISERFKKINSDLIHSGISPMYAENETVDTLSREILDEIGNVEQYDELRKALRNMFFIGQLGCK